MFNIRKNILFTLCLCSAFLLFHNAAAQNFQILGPKLYSLKEGDSISIHLINLQTQPAPGVLIKIINPDPNFLHVPASGEVLRSLNILPHDTGSISCVYFPKAPHPDTALIIISEGVQQDSVLIFSSDTSNGIPDLMR